jgi:peptide/nickel transport system substrate-binding protein
LKIVLDVNRAAKSSRDSSMKFHRLSASALAMIGAGTLWLPAAFAADLTYAISAPVTAVDPHYQNATPNNSTLSSIFETLVKADPQGKIIPGLATSWKLVDDVTWEFKLANATFHDGTPFSAEDVKASLERPAQVPNSPSPFTTYTRPIVRTEIVDDHTIRLISERPHPGLLQDLTYVLMVPKAGGSTQDFNSGKAAIGTGPYKFVRFTPDDRIVMTRNENYWGEKPAWDNVTVRFIPNNGARAAALLSKAVDAIENVPPPDLPRFQNNNEIVFKGDKSRRLVFLFLDSGSEQAPTVKANDGSPLAANPLKDPRVRKAISLAINRKALSERVLMGLGYPTTNIVFDGGEGHLPTLDEAPYDLQQAKKLLAEAGYPDGFRITLATPNNRMLNDAQVAQAIAQMLTQAGIKTEVDAMPFTVINTRGGRGEFGFTMMGWGNTVDGVSTVRAIIACKNDEKGLGPVNWGNYCNPEIDDLTLQAAATMDPAQRRPLLEQVSEKVAEDAAIVPLYFQGMTWAARKGITIEPRSDERTTPGTFAPAN